MKTILLFLLQFTFADISRAATLDKQSVGLRTTNNVYLENENPVSDSYLLLNSRMSFFPGRQVLQATLDYADYFRENPNDFLNLRLKVRPSPNRVFSFFHRNYLHGNAATSDTSFTHTGIGFDLEKESTPRANWLFFGSAGYQGRHYHDFDGRNDHQLSVFASLDFAVHSRITPYLYSGLGFVLSSQSAYSLTFLDLGGGVKGPISPSWSWSLDLDIRATTYANRRIDDVIEVRRSRGSTVLVNVSERERTQVSILGGALKWQINNEFDFESRVNFGRQSSNNPNLEYRNNEVYLTLSYRGKN